MKVKIGIVDDHQLFLKSLSILIDKFPLFETSVEALNGEMLLQKLEGQTELPDIVLIDLNMPVMNGVETAKQVSKKYPQVRLAALSMKDDDTSIISMFQAGCCAYLLKDIHPDELEKALQEIHRYGYYNADAMNIHHRRLDKQTYDPPPIYLSAREKEFLQHACSDKTYKQIAGEMFLSERTIDGYREALFGKFNVQSRVGMVLEALRRNLVSLR